jgi:dipeptidyl-peptidase-4
MDETHVPTYPITDFAPVTAQVQNEKYPKPGDPNPAVRLGVVSAKGGKTKWISVTDDADIYIPRFGWVRDGVVWAEVLNRTQDRMDLYFIDAKSGHMHKMLTEAVPDAWVPVTDDFQVLKSNDRFTWSSWRDGHLHVYLYSFDKQNPLAADAKLERQLTKGDFETLGVEGVDDAAGVVYVSANEGDPRQEQVYSVKFDGSEWQKVSKEPGVHKATFSPDAKHYVDAHSASLTPTVRSVCPAAGGTCHDLWQPRSVAEYNLIAPKDLEFKAEDGSTLYGQLLLPQNASGQVPLVVYIYGGPAAQLVVNQWSAGVTDPFNELLAQHGIAIFSVDNRGTPHRGRKFEAAIRHEFGEVELKDQLTALNQLFSQYPMLDKNRTCIWGWSNGGSMTLYSLLHSEVFHCGISGAPVTDWHLYDSAYTERYLGLPKQNPKPYDNSLPSAAASLKASLLLIHGTSDDNVHVQNSIQMIDSLINNNKQFRLMIYPGKTHGVTGNQRLHLYEMMLNFFEENLKGSR